MRRPRKTSAAEPPTAEPLRPRDYLILLALSGGKCHGYGLIREIEQITGDGVRMDPANLHRAIQRMIRDGLVDDLGRQPTDGVDRRVYQLSEAGQSRARSEAARLERLTSAARARRLLPESEGSP